MRVILVGCEYSGTTTLAFRIREWIHSEIGGHVNLVHDHFKIPYTVTHPDEYTSVAPNFTAEEQDQFLALSPRIKDNIMRHNVVYHTAALPGMADKVIVGLHIEEAVYGELYFGYTDRRGFMDGIETKILGTAPDTVLCLVTASTEVIMRRMTENPHPNGVLKEPDIELVLRRFKEEFEQSRLTHKVSLDTSDATIDESVAEFVRMVEPHIPDNDRAQMAAKS